MPLKTHQETLPELNLTPMIDVVFLLIIFFMVGTKFAEMERTVKLEVPQVANLGASTTSPAKRVVHVYHDGSLRLDAQDVTLAELEEELRAVTRQTSDLMVLVRGDATGPFQHVATVLTACKNAGVRDLGISVQLETATGSATKSR
jgi:biopolymer transport protein ExbD